MYGRMEVSPIGAQESLPVSYSRHYFQQVPKDISKRTVNSPSNLLRCEKKKKSYSSAKNVKKHCTFPALCGSIAKFLLGSIEKREEESLGRPANLQFQTRRAVVWIGQTQKRTGREERGDLRKTPGGFSDSEVAAKELKKTRHALAHAGWADACVADWHGHARRPPLTRSDAGKHTRVV